jgi:hypothetical protein
MELIITNADEYEKAVKRIDQARLEAYCATIPSNVNPAGNHFRRLIKKFKAQHHDTTRKINK